MYAFAYERMQRRDITKSCSRNIFCQSGPHVHRLVTARMHYAVFHVHTYGHSLRICPNGQRPSHAPDRYARTVCVYVCVSVYVCKVDTWIFPRRLFEH